MSKTSKFIPENHNQNFPIIKKKFKKKSIVKIFNNFLNNKADVNIQIILLRLTNSIV